MGITPAWAGKRGKPLRILPEPGDHPRMGGEKRNLAGRNPCNLGSPPHGRGKVFCVYQVFIPEGITPAWAGKSYLIGTGLGDTEDHPRMGGEKLQGM